MSETAISMRGVRYVYPDGYVALDDVSLEIRRGERIAILGPNGAGKSTLMLNMAGVLTPSQGEMKILGMPVKDENMSDIRRNVGLTFQNPDDQLFCSTVLEDVAYGPLNLGLSQEEAASRARDALRQVGLEGYEDRLPHHLSEGEKKKVAIATVLSMRPKILMIDEPTANLDPKSREELTELIRDVVKTYDITLIIATHDVDLVPRLVDKIFILSKGQIIADGPMREIFHMIDLLHEARLEPPTIFKLFYLAAEKKEASSENIPITMNEAVDAIQSMIQRQASDTKKSRIT